MLDPGEKIATMLAKALPQLGARAGSASIVLATVARMPDERYVGPLATLEHFAGKTPGWRGLGLIASGLLDLLDPARTPAGAA